MGEGLVAALGRGERDTQFRARSVRSFRGQIGVRQIHGARHAIQENGGGLPVIEEAALAVHIQSK